MIEKYWTFNVFINDKGETAIEEWEWLKRQKVAHARIGIILSRLEIRKEWNRPLFDVIHGYDKLHEIRIKWKNRIELRLFGCYGPNKEKEFTILVGAIERDGKYKPRNAIEKAKDRIALINQKECIDEY